MTSNHNTITFNGHRITRHPERKGLGGYVTVVNLETGADLIDTREGKALMQEAVREQGMSPNGMLYYVGGNQGHLITHHYADALLEHIYGLAPTVAWSATGRDSANDHPDLPRKRTTRQAPPPATKRRVRRGKGSY